MRREEIGVSSERRPQFAAALAEHGVLRFSHLARSVESEPVRWYYCVMIPEFRDDGLLPPGVHWADWDELSERFGWTPQRRALLAGLRSALDNLKQAGCRVAYVDGSFVTDKLLPNDYDACWEEDGVDPAALDHALLTFDHGRVVQRSQYLGELFPASSRAAPDGSTFFEFFQSDRVTGNPKGIVAIDLRGLR